MICSIANHFEIV